MVKILKNNFWTKIRLLEKCESSRAEEKETYDKMKVDDLICSDFRDVITIFRFI